MRFLKIMTYKNERGSHVISQRLLRGEHDMLFTCEPANQKARKAVFTCVVCTIEISIHISCSYCHYH